MPLITPLAAPIVATDVLPLLHKPPVTASLHVVAAPMHTLPLPVIADGSALTVIVFVTMQPAPIAYVIIAVPALTPLTIPLLDPTVAVAVLLQVHIPPVGKQLCVVAEPTHTLLLPVMAEGTGFTVMPFVAMQPVGSA
jgi:hypothetical protein